MLEVKLQPFLQLNAPSIYVIINACIPIIFLSSQICFCQDDLWLNSNYTGISVWFEYNRVYHGISRRNVNLPKCNKLSDEMNIVTVDQVLLNG